MKRYISIRIIVVAFVAMFAVLLGSTGAYADGTTPPAPASETVSSDDITTATWNDACNQQANTSTCVKGSSSSSSTATDVATAELKSGTRVVGEYIVKNGLTKKQVKGKKCKWMKGGYNTIRTSTGAIVKYKDNRSQYVCNMGKGVYKVKKCGNRYYPAGKTPSKSYKTVYNPIVVKTLTNYTVSGSATINTVADSVSTSTSTAVCENSSASASGYAKARASASVRMAFSYKFRSETSLKGAVRSAKLKQQSSFNLSAYAKASSEASTQSRSAASCSGTPTTPPSTPPGSIIEITTPNHVIWNNSRTFNVQGIVPDSKGTLRVSSNIGTIAASDKSIDLASRVNAKGEFNFTITYTAPDEGSSDTLTFDLYNASGKKDDSKSVVVPLKAPPVDPS